MDAVPLAVCVPDQLFEPAQPDASVEDQVKVEDCPAATMIGLTLKVMADDAVAVPVNETVTGLLDALEAMDNVPLIEPGADGLNVTEMEQVPFTVTVVQFDV